MFSKVFINCKKDYGENIKNAVCNILDELGIKHTGKIEKGIDLAVLIGGDGTLLKYQSKLNCPVLGINPGRSVGYYMSAGPNDFLNKLLRVLNGKEGKEYFVHKLMRLETRINGNPLKELALNDVLVSPIYARRILDAEVRIGKEKSLERSSGILVYTPTGSYAFAQSAGAKTLPYDSKKFGVVSIAPYFGRLRKGEILLDKGEVWIRCMNREGEVCIDGQETQIYRISQGDVITVRKSKYPSKVIGFGKRFK
jgi:NAD kinase